MLTISNIDKTGLLIFFFTKKPGAGVGRADSLVFAAGRVVSERFVLGCQTMTHRDGNCLFSILDQYGFAVCRKLLPGE